MDNLVITELTRLQLTRTSRPLSKPIIIHLVAGAGKTTIIRKLLTIHHTIRAFTCGTPDPPSLTGTHILPWKSERPGTTTLLDEYPLATDYQVADFCFADPIQHNITEPYPHFTSNFTHRVPEPICNHLRSLTFDIHSTKAGSLTFENIFQGEPIGTIIAWEPEIIRLLNSHQADYLRPCQALGLQFDTVTVITLEPKPTHLYYIACTRSLNKLIIKCLSPHRLTT
uniref:Triple gene block protein 1 n=1 Tax=Desert rose mottle virus TaxID=3074535 RepID=A0AA51WDI6_9VIRU|nr:triple gene block protein 1 [Desert rose mottle virus]